MKKLKLKNLKLNSNDLLQKKQLVYIHGGGGYMTVTCNFPDGGYWVGSSPHVGDGPVSQITHDQIVHCNDNGGTPFLKVI